MCDALERTTRQRHREQRRSASRRRGGPGRCSSPSVLVQLRALEDPPPPLSLERRRLSPAYIWWWHCLSPLGTGMRRGFGGEEGNAALTADWPVCAPQGGTSGVRGASPKPFLTQPLPEVTSITSEMPAGDGGTVWAWRGCGLPGLRQSCGASPTFRACGSARGPEGSPPPPLQSGRFRRHTRGRASGGGVPSCFLTAVGCSYRHLRRGDPQRRVRED